MNPTMYNCNSWICMIKKSRFRSSFSYFGLYMYKKA